MITKISKKKVVKKVVKEPKYENLSSLRKWLHTNDIDPEDLDIFIDDREVTVSSGWDDMLKIELEESEQLPHCCGIIELGGFTVSCNNYPIPDGVLVDSISELIEKQIEDIRKHIPTRRGCHKLLMVNSVVNDKTEKLLDLAAEKCGFEVIATFKNANSGNTIVSRTKLVSK